MPKLDWQERKLNNAVYYEAILGDFLGDDGVRFSLVMQPTCHRRGVWKLLIEVAEGHFQWGCFDESDQPMRYYHVRENALSEAEAIAQVLWEYRYSSPPVGAA